MSVVRGLITTFVLVSASKAFAIVPVCLHHGLNDLIEEARVFGPVDYRKELTAAAKDLNLTPAEVAQIRQSVGAFYCPKEPGFDEPAVGTAFLVGSRREIITAGHLVTNEAGQTRDLSKCFFENFEIPPKRIPLAAKHSRNIVPKSNPRDNERQGDRARLVLSKPVSGAKPFTVDKTGKALAKGDSTILIGAQNDDFKSSGMDPILIPCTIEDVRSGTTGPDRVLSGCSTDIGGSGGPYLARVNGKLVVKAMAVSVKERLKDGGQPNHSEYNGINNFNAGLSITGDFLDWF